MMSIEDWILQRLPLPCYTCKTIPNTTHTQNAGRECLPPSLLRHLSFPYKARLRNIAHSSWSWHQKALVMAPYNGRKPSKILTTHRVRSRAKITAFFGVLQSTTIKTRILFRTMQGASPPFLRQNTSKTRQNKRKKRDFPPKTPGFFAINIRTFGAKHRNIPSKKSDVFTFLTMTDFTSQIICYFTTSLHIFCNVFLRCFTGFVCCS